MPHALALSLAMVAAGCSLNPDVALDARCASDAECGSQQVCFVDGCADPNLDLVAEVSGDPIGGQYPQDIDVPTVGSTLNLALSTPLKIVGQFQRERTTQVDPTNRAVYSEPVVVRAYGRSALLPGITRNYEAKFSQTSLGAFSMFVGSGNYRLEASPEDRGVPPEHGSSLLAGETSPQTSVTFAFASVDGAARMQGRLVRIKGVPILEAPMDVQAFDPMSRLPLSQVTEVSSGNLGSTGDFTMPLHPRAKGLPLVSIVATPRRSGALVPRKDFSVPLPLDVPLEMGEYGMPLLGLRGTVLGPDGLPVGDAQVALESRAGVNGVFRSKLVTTDQTGMFSVDLLPSLGGNTYAAVVIPPPGARAGLWRGQLSAKGAAGSQPAMLTPGTLNCPTRVHVMGTLQTHDGLPAVNVRLRAHFLGEVGVSNLTLDVVDAVTNEQGVFELMLDPGEWRLDFQPTAVTFTSSSQYKSVGSPPMSRIIEVSSVLPSGNRIEALTLDTFVLPRSRVVEGVVTRDGIPLPNATIRLFRVIRAGAEASSVLVATTTADADGFYRVVLPTR